MEDGDDWNMPCVLSPYCCPYDYGPNHDFHHYHYVHVKCIPTGRLLDLKAEQDFFPMYRYDQYMDKTRTQE